jgi:hypothetical protein
MLLDEPLQVAKELFDPVQVWRVWRQEYKLHTCTKAHLFDAISMVERGIVHDEHTLRLGPAPTMLE